MTMDSHPIACTLGAKEYQDRLTWIADLARDALQSHRRDDLALHLRYAPAAVRRVREMVRKEEACCAFLTFEMHERSDAILLTIKAPEAARTVAGALFEHFVVPARDTETRGCASGPRTPTVR
jgi:hypothetical protein